MVFFLHQHFVENDTKSIGNFRVFFGMDKMRLLCDQFFHIIQFCFIISIGRFQTFVYVNEEVFPGDDTVGNAVCGMGIFGRNHGNHMGFNFEGLIAQQQISVPVITVADFHKIMKMKACGPCPDAVQPVVPGQKIYGKLWQSVVISEFYFGFCVLSIMYFFLLIYSFYYTWRSWFKRYARAVMSVTFWTFRPQSDAAEADG